jgi:hypothetical protein
MRVNHRALPRLFKPSTRVGIRFKASTGDWVTLLGFLTGRPWQIRAVSSQNWAARSLDAYDVVVTDERPSLPSSVLVETIGPFAIYKLHHAR